MKFMHLLKMAIPALMLALSAPSSFAAFPEAEYQEANAHLKKANEGDKSQIEPAVEKFDKLQKANPTHPLLLVKLGTVTAMQARTTGNPFKKMSFAEDGMGMQDKALQMLTPAHDTELHNNVPVSLLVRFDAASTFLNVPAMFNRRAEGDKLINAVMKSPLFEKTPNAFKALVWMRAAKHAEDQKRVVDAKNLYTLVKATDTPQAEAANVRLVALQ